MSVAGARIFRERRETISGEPAGAAGVSLAAMRPGQFGTIVGVESTDARLLQKLLALALLPGTEIRVDMTFPAFVLRVGRTRVALDRSIADRIRVERLTPPHAPDCRARTGSTR